MEVIHVDENGKVIKKKFDVKAAWEKTKAKVHETVEKARENKEVVIAVGSVAVPAVIELCKMASKGRARRADEKHRKMSMWDPVEGHWWELRRELTSREYLEVEDRVKHGEKRGEVLYDMRLLK